jgi:hypothetical protein
MSVACHQMPAPAMEIESRILAHLISPNGYFLAHRARFKPFAFEANSFQQAF